jgi:subtilisin
MNPVARLLSAVCVLVGLSAVYGAIGAQQPERAAVAAAVIAQAQATGSAHVIVTLRTGFIPEGRMDSLSSASQRVSIARVQSVVMNRLAATVSGGRLDRFQFIPALAGRVSAQAIDALRTMPEVASVEEDVLNRPTLAQSVPQINVPAAWTAGYTGAGWSVAILDTGVQTNHPFLAAKTVSEACFSNAGGDGGLTSLCPGGATSSTATGSGVNCSIPVWGDGCAHGTHVAGIAAGLDAGQGFSGVAKAGSLIPMQVFSGDQVNGGVGAFSSDLIRAMERVFTLATTRPDFHIASVNMSLGGSFGYDTQASCDMDNPSEKAAIDNLRSIGIATVVASGNGDDAGIGSTNAITAPACISSAISVGSVNDSSASAFLPPGRGPQDTVSSFSNSAPFLSLLAPGSVITSSVPDNTFATFEGTSMATPHVAGAWALMKQRKPSASVTEILSALSATGVQIAIPGAGYSKPRINVNTAINAVRVDFIAMDAPVANTTAKGPFTATGWALNMSALSGTGVDSVHVWAFPRPSGAPVFLGVAAYGGARPDVGGIFGSQFTNAGWTLTVNALAPGTYDINAYARNTFNGTFSQVATTPNVTVLIDPRMSIDTPANGAVVFQPFRFAGWALDRGATAGTTGIDAVHVYAFPAAGAPPLFLGVASYGIARPDVGDAFGPQFTSSGWGITVEDLPAGPYLVAAYGHDQLTNTFSVVQSIRLTIPPQMSVDTPVNGSTHAVPFTVAGWAIDRRAASTTGVDAIHVWAYPDPGSNAPAQFVGLATLGVARDDVGTAFGSQFTNSGYAIAVTDLPAGHTYRLAVYVHSSVTGSFNQVQFVDVVVP